jgi:hypothetical protein
VFFAGRPSHGFSNATSRLAGECDQRFFREGGGGSAFYFVMQRRHGRFAKTGSVQMDRKAGTKKYGARFFCCFLTRRLCTIADGVGAVAGCVQHHHQSKLRTRSHTLLHLLGAKTRLFCAVLWLLKNPSIYQDRLGTNMGNVFRGKRRVVSVFCCRPSAGSLARRFRCSSLPQGTCRWAWCQTTGVRKEKRLLLFKERRRFYLMLKMIIFTKTGSGRQT